MEKVINKIRAIATVYGIPENKLTEHHINEAIKFGAKNEQSKFSVESQSMEFWKRVDAYIDFLAICDFWHTYPKNIGTEATSALRELAVETRLKAIV